MRTRIFVERSIGRHAYELYIYKEVFYGPAGAVRREVAIPLTALQFRIPEPQEEGQPMAPTLSLGLHEGGQDTLQELMDELWRVGLRPTEGAGSAGAMAATQAHLEDMRAIVAKLTKVEWKEPRRHA